MDRRKKKMLLAILMIISVLAADFFVLGSGIMTYASELGRETNNTNIEFSVYFKEGENRIDSVEKSIRDADVKLYAEIKVKNEGYLKEGTVIELENSNFNLKSEMLDLNTNINSIQGNKVNLKQINAGETVELELDIEPAVPDKITTDYLSQTSKVKMIGTYVYSRAEDGESITSDKEVCINYQPDDTTGAELTSEIITNKELSVNGINKRIVQLLIKSRITNNEYPIKQTTISADIPEIKGETPEVSAMAINKLATNGATEITDVKTEDGEVKITINNNPDENNQINWNKNIYDEIVITYIYSDAVKASDIVYIDTSVWMNVYNYENPYMAILKSNQAIGETIPESNNIIIGRSQIATKELYKGKLYTKSELTYNTKTEVVVTNPNIVEEVVIHEGPDVFGTTESEISANTKYASTEINLEKMLEIVGQDGNIEIKNGETRTLINKETEVNENGNVVINHENGTSELYITTSNPVKAGILEIKHTKVIAENSYTREQLQEVKTLIAKGSLEGTITVDKEKQSVISKDMESGTIELKETISKAELTIENNKTELSTTQENELTLGITLVTNGEQYDLYKNPKISLKFPEAIENVELLSTPTKQNADEFTVNVGEFNATKKTMQIDMQGEQTVYPSSSLTQSYIQLNLKVKLSSLATTTIDRIMMAYTNENAVQYVGGTTDLGIAEQIIHISAPSQLIKVFNISTNESTSLTESIQQQITKENIGQTVSFETILVNNIGSDMKNVRILGKLPTTGNTITGEEENTLQTTLTNLTAENATIYYTENTNATADIQNSENGWTTNSANAKMYLIDLGTLALGSNYKTVTKVQIPSSIQNKQTSYTQYEVIYDTDEETNITEMSRKISLKAKIYSTLEATLTAQVGNELLKNGDKVKEGEVVKYTATLTNNTSQILKNIEFKTQVPEGTVLVQPIEDYEYSANTYYEEITDSEKISKITSNTIAQLQPEAEVQIQYEVRVKTNITTGTKISNQAIATYNNNQIESELLENEVEESNIRVTIKRVDDEENIYAAGLEGVKFSVYIENLSDEVIKNLKLQIPTDTFTVTKVEIDNTTLIGEQIAEQISINEILANKGINVLLVGKIGDDIERLELSTIITDSNEEQYRSNLISEKLENVDATITLTSKPENGTYVSNGQKIEYYSTVTNTGEKERKAVAKFEISEYLEIQSVYINDELYLQKINNPIEVDKNDETYTPELELDTKIYKETISNNISYSKILKVGESINIKIVAKVNSSAVYQETEIFSKASVNVLQAVRDSEQVIHIMTNDMGLIESTTNTISGLVWLDTNENGKIDINESALKNVYIKIYDNSTQSYLKNNEGTEKITKTNSDGSYILYGIEDGTYSIVFRYDETQYEPTKYRANGVDTSENSKGYIQEKLVHGRKTELTATDAIQVQESVENINLGLKSKTENPPEEDPKEPVKPEKPEDTPGMEENKNSIKGLAWLDSDRDGRRDFNEKVLSEIKVKLYEASTGKYITETITKSNGAYTFSNVEKGSYIIMFKYNTEEYEPTTYCATGVETILNSKAVLKKVRIDGQEQIVAITDKIDVQENVSNINIGLKEKLKFDLELNKYISKIVVQTKKGTKTYDYTNSIFEKVEIHRKQIQGTLVVLEYVIEVKNTGEVPGYVKNIVDNMPNGLVFSSELNTDWYLSGNKLYSKCLENIELKPGQQKQIKLILTKTMTNENVGLINNRAEIYQDYNEYGESDIDSTPNNNIQSEDDMGSTDVAIVVGTGGSIIGYIILIMLNLIIIGMVILIIKNKVIIISIEGSK